MARGLFEMGVWLHPDESKALFEALDEDDGGTVDSKEFCAFWEKYGT
jgi:Ca2+-binding EF-hand superfamily protein